MQRAGYALRLIGFVFAATATAVLGAEPPRLGAEPPRPGADVYRSHCVVCHGSEGRGDGRAATVLATRPANLTTSHLTTDEIRNIVTLGGTGVGRSSSMPPWGEALSAADVDAVVAFVCSIAGSCRPGSDSVVATAARISKGKNP